MWGPWLVLAALPICTSLKGALHTGESTCMMAANVDGKKIKSIASKLFDHQLIGNSSKKVVVTRPSILWGNLYICVIWKHLFMEGKKTTDYPRHCDFQLIE